MMGKSRSLVVLHKSVPRLVPRRCSHFSGCGQAESTSQASGWRSGLCLPQRSASCGAPFAPGLFHPGKHEPFLQGSLCTVFTSGVWEPPPPETGQESPGSPWGWAALFPFPGLQGAPQGEWWPFPTGLCCCLAPSSGREGEGAAGGRQARAHHRGSGERPSAPGPTGGRLSPPSPCCPPSHFFCLSTSVFPFHPSFPIPLPPSLPFSCFLPLCLGTGPLQS